jgi:hypothetical protein
VRVEISLLGKGVQRGGFPFTNSECPEDLNKTTSFAPILSTPHIPNSTLCYYYPTQSNFSTSLLIYTKILHLLNSNTNHSLPIPSILSRAPSLKQVNKQRHKPIPGYEILPIRSRKHKVPNLSFTCQLLTNEIATDISEKESSPSCSCSPPNLMKLC